MREQMRHWNAVVPKTAFDVFTERTPAASVRKNLQELLLLKLDGMRSSIPDHGWR
jgi:hypothetical protein